MRRDVVGKMSAPPAKRLPWTYHYALGYNGSPIDEIKAKQIAERVGVIACNDLGHTPLIVAAMLGRMWWSSDLWNAKTRRKLRRVYG